ncbi:hypothetical protein Efla_006692 [Eimeria flavescens]
MFQGRQLRRFVEVPAPEEGFRERLDMEFSYALNKSRTRTREHAWEDYWRRWTAFHYAEYEQAPSSSGDEQPPSPQQQVQESIPNRLLRTLRPREDNLDSGLFEQSARRQRTQILPASASDLIRAYPNDREREESEAEERHCEGIRRGDAPGARPPRSSTPRPVSSPGEQGPLAATEVPRLQGAPSPGVPANEGPPSSAESSPQESAGEESPVAPSASGRVLEMVPSTFVSPAFPFSRGALLI